MYLTRLVLDQRSRTVRRDLSDCQALHRTIMRAFPRVETADNARARFGVLHRVEAVSRSSDLVVLVQSRDRPNWSHLEPGYLRRTAAEGENPACASLDTLHASLAMGTLLRFRLRANPTRKVGTKSDTDGSKHNGRRVPYYSEADQLIWLSRKGSTGGFGLPPFDERTGAPNVRVGHGSNLTGHRASVLSPIGAATNLLTFAAVQFEGYLRVTNVDVFRRTLLEGVGPGKAYGFGLLSIAPVNRA